MPIPRYWSEEVVLEWLLLEGYLAEANVPLGSSRSGGRKEADVIGAKFEDDRLEVVHAEVGGVTSSLDEGIRAIKRKFSKNREESVIEEVKRRLGARSEVKVRYKPIFIATYASKISELKQGLKEEGIEFWMMDEFILTKLLEAIEKWKMRRKEEGKVKNERYAVLPESYWLSYLVDYLNSRGYFRKEPR